MPKFITLAGRKQVGKDTSARLILDLLVQHRCQAAPPSLDMVGQVVHFADALKRACSIIFGIPIVDMETEEGKQKLTHLHWPYRNAMSWQAPGKPASTNRMTVREVLQFVGTELFREQLDPDVWVQSVFRQPYDCPFVVVADARFPNEAELARERGLLIKVERDTGLASDSHASETALDDYDNYHYIVQNNGSFDDLRDKLSVILSREGFLTV